MQNQITYKPTKLLSFFISVFIVLDGFSMLAFGLIYLYLSYIGDPAPYDTSKGTTIFYAKVTAWLTFAYFIICFISLVYWLIGKATWGFVILVLGVLPFGVSSYLLIMYSDLINDLSFLKYPLYGSLVINSLLLVFITSDIIRSKSIIQSKNG